MRVYNFRQDIPAQKTGTIDVPAKLVGQKGARTVVADAMYRQTSHVLDRTPTGVIVVGALDQDSYLAVHRVRKLTITKASLRYTDAQIQDNVDQDKTLGLLLGVLRTTGPITAGILGLLLVITGFSLRSSRRIRGAP